jgi:hypothetical protein
LIGVLASNPFDVVKSRIQGSVKASASGTKGDGGAGKGRHYRGAVDCFRKSVQEEGLAVLYSGAVPNFCRKVGAPHCSRRLLPLPSAGR